MARRRKSSRTGPKFSMVMMDMQNSPAFWSLAPSSIRLLIYLQWKNSFTVATRDDREAGMRPAFKCTNAEAKAELGMGAQTFTNAKAELERKGFITVIKRGGLKGCNGVASRFALSGEWKQWTSPTRSHNAARDRPLGKNGKQVQRTGLVLVQPTG